MNYIRIFLIQHNETLLDVVNMVVSQIRKMPELSDAEKAMLDTYTDMQQDLLGLRALIDKNRK